MSDIPLNPVLAAFGFETELQQAQLKQFMKASNSFLIGFVPLLWALYERGELTEQQLKACSSSSTDESNIHGSFQIFSILPSYWNAAVIDDHIQLLKSYFEVILPYEIYDKAETYYEKDESNRMYVLVNNNVYTTESKSKNHQTFIINFVQLKDDSVDSLDDYKRCIACKMPVDILKLTVPKEMDFVSDHPTLTNDAWRALLDKKHFHITPTPEVTTPQIMRTLIELCYAIGFAIPTEGTKTLKEALAAYS